MTQGDSIIVLGTISKECIYKSQYFVEGKSLTLKDSNTRNSMLSPYGGWVEIEQNLLVLASEAATLYNYCYWTIAGLKFWGYCTCAGTSGGIVHYDIALDAPTTYFEAYYPLDSVKVNTGERVKMRFSAMGSDLLPDDRRALNPEIKKTFLQSDEINSRINDEIIDGSVVVQISEAPRGSLSEYTGDVYRKLAGGSFDLTSKTYILPWNSWMHFYTQINESQPLAYEYDEIFNPIGPGIGRKEFSGIDNKSIVQTGNQVSALLEKRIVNVYWLPYSIQKHKNEPVFIQNFKEVDEISVAISVDDSMVGGTIDRYDSEGNHFTYTGAQVNKLGLPWISFENWWKDNNGTTHVFDIYQANSETKQTQTTAVPSDFYWDGPVINFNENLENYQKFNAQITFATGLYNIFVFKRADFTSAIKSISTRVFLDLSGQSYTSVLMINGSLDYRFMANGSIGGSMPLSFSNSLENWNEYRSLLTRRAVTSLASSVTNVAAIALGSAIPIMSTIRERRNLIGKINELESLSKKGMGFVSSSNYQDYYNKREQLKDKLEETNYAAGLGSSAVSGVLSVNSLASSVSDFVDKTAALKQADANIIGTWSVSGSAGSAGLINFHKCYIVITWNDYAEDEQFENQYGKPDNQFRQLGTVINYAKSSIGTSKYVMIASPIVENSKQYPTDIVEAASNALSQGCFLY